MRFAGLTVAALLTALSWTSHAVEKKPRAPEKTPEKPAEVQIAEKKEKSPESVAPNQTLVAPKGPARVDFDDRLLQGQSNRLGAVYLYQRKEPVLPSLLDRRKSFRSEIKRDVLE